MDQENILSCMWWHAPRISAQKLLEEEDCAFEANLSYVEGTIIRKQHKNVLSTLLDV